MRVCRTRVRKQAPWSRSSGSRTRTRRAIKRVIYVYRTSANNPPQQILDKDRNARIITAGDFNEFTFVQPLTTYASLSGLKDLDAAAGVKDVERYTYLFDMSSQQLDHMFVSKAIADRKAKYEHVHINTWVDSAAMVSDHDPSVARLDVCA